MEYFETIKCENFKIYNLEYHEDRIYKTIGKKIKLENYIKPMESNLLRCKFIYNEEKILDTQFYHYKPKEIRSFKIVYSDNIIYNKKYLNRQNIDKLLLKKENCDEIIIVKNGIVTDTSIATVAVKLNKQWIVSKNTLLFSTTKNRLLNEKKIKEKDINIEMLKQAKQIAVLNAMVDFFEIKNFVIHY